MEIKICYKSSNTVRGEPIPWRATVEVPDDCDIGRLVRVTGCQSVSPLMQKGEFSREEFRTGALVGGGNIY